MLRAVLLSLACLPGIALAGDPDTPVAAPGPVAAPVADPALSFTLGLGAQVTPEYFGSDDYTTGPWGRFSLHSVNIGRLRVGDPDPDAEQLGFGLRGSLRYISERDASDHSELAGLDDIDAALELGLGLGYTGGRYMAFLDARRGFGGHEFWVAEAGADAILRPSDDLTFTMGPRFFWGSDDYADTYFGIAPDEASADLPAYDAGGGLLSAGVEFGATYRFNENWGLDGAVTYERFLNDAEDSPIVRQGSEEQWGVSIGLTRVIRLGF